MNGIGSARLDKWLTKRGSGSGAALARDLSVTQETVSRWRMGHVLPSYEMRKALEDATGIPVTCWHKEAGR